MAPLPPMSGGGSPCRSLPVSPPYVGWVVALLKSALALSMGLRYKPRPMHTLGGYDASSFYSLRQVEEIVAAPVGSPPAITTRHAQVKMLLRPEMHQMCEAFDIAVPDSSDCQGGIALAILEDPNCQDGD